MELGIRSPGSFSPLVTAEAARHGRVDRVEGPSEEISVGLINNMSDSALEATERQFATLLAAAAGPSKVRVQLFSLPEIHRSDHARTFMMGRYLPIDRLADAHLDALIVTGAEPITDDLAHELYWPSLTRVIDWAENGTLSTIWSCLAAHAAVLHLDGVRRRSLASKLSGVFACQHMRGAPLLANVPARMLVPHSRLNDLAQEDLRAHGYRILTRSDRAGVDMFMKERRSLFVFLQGHPEYEADSLMREYRRDIGRFLRGERARSPAPPEGYFDPDTERALLHLTALVAGDPHPGLMPRYDELVSSREIVCSWGQSALRFYKNWLSDVGARKSARSNESDRFIGVPLPGHP